MMQHLSEGVGPNVYRGNGDGRHRRRAARRASVLESATGESLPIGSAVNTATEALYLGTFNEGQLKIVATLRERLVDQTLELIPTVRSSHKRRNRVNVLSKRRVPNIVRK